METVWRKPAAPVTLNGHFLTGEKTMQMKSGWLKARVLAGLCALVLLVPTGAGADERHGGFRPFDRIVVFGTSLSDPGNAFLLTGQNVSAPDYGMSGPSLLTLIPSYPYAAGRNHFSNGATWIEQLAAPIGLSWSVKPAFVQSIAGSSNYAVGGTRARDGVAGEVSLSQQVGNFLRDAGPQASSRSLYVMEMGGNDVRDAIEGDQAAIPQALAYLGEAIVRLYSAGARKFLVWNVPNLGRAPAIRALDAYLHATQGIPAGAVIAGATAASMGYNGGLAQVLNGLEAALPGIDIVQFDSFATTEAIVSHPLRYGLQNATEACLAPLTPLPSRCANPDRYLFWDGIHPTRAGHAIIAINAGKALIADFLAAH
jgi:phospholipase/lecithinase/hemolysin